MKFILKLIVFLVIVLAIFVLARNFILKAGIETGARIATGLELKMGEFKIGIIETDIVIKDLKIYNPKGYDEEIMLHMPEITIDYNLTNILKGLIHMESIVINLEEFNVVKNSNGDVNLNELPAVQKAEKGQKEKKKEEPKKKEKGKGPNLQIDNLELRFNKVSFQDYSKKKPSINDLKLNIDEQYENITDPTMIMAIILQKIILKASLSKISGFGLDGIGSALGDQYGNLSEMSAKYVGQAKDLADGAMDSVKDISASATKASDLSEETASASKEAYTKTKDAVAEQTKKLGELAGSIFKKEE